MFVPILQAKNGYIKRVYDEDIKSMVLEIMGTNVSTIYIMSPPDPKQRLGIKLPFLILLIKNLHKYFTFEVKASKENLSMIRNESISIGPGPQSLSRSNSSLWI